MSAPGRSPRHRPPRAVHPLLASLVAVVTAITIAIAILPVVVAHDPGTGSSGGIDDGDHDRDDGDHDHDDDDAKVGTLTVAPTHGRVTDAFQAIFRAGDHHGRCKSSSVTFSWDGAEVGSSRVDPASCKATFAFDAPPTATVGSHEISAVACHLDFAGQRDCDTDRGGTARYHVDATPTLTLSLSAGDPTTPFRATFATNEDRCSYRSAAFFWDDTEVGLNVAMNALCVAVVDFARPPPPNGPGSHVLRAEACRRTCDPGSIVQRSFVITVVTPAGGPTAAPTAAPTAKPTAEPTAKPTARPTAAPTARPAAAPTARPTARPRAKPAAAPAAVPDASPVPSSPDSPSSEPSALPSSSGLPSASGSPSPSDLPVASASPAASGGLGPASSQAVLEATSPPRSTPSSGPGAVVTPSSGPGTPGPNPYVPEIATYIGGPDAGPMDLAVVSTNLFLTFLLIFLFGLTAEIFNSTMDANRTEVHGWWAGLLGGPLRFLGPLVVTGASLDRLAGSGRAGSLLRVFAVLALLGLVYGFLSPDFGLNASSVILFLSLVIGLGFLTYWSEGSASRLATRRFRAQASIKLYGTAILVAVLAVIVSRTVSFQPGLIYGFIASAVIVAPIALAKRDDATLVLVPAFGLLVVSLLAWLLLGPVRLAAADGEPLPALVETILAMIVIGGIEGLFITMIPLRFLDGSTVMGWSRVGWAVVFGTVTFLWWQLLVNQNAAYVKAFEQTNVQVVLAVLIVFMLTTGGIWSYFRFRPSPSEPEA